MKKKAISTEFCYLAGVVLLALGTALMEKAGFGMSMVVAPAYLIHLKLCQILPFFTFGMAGYTFQALLLVGMILALRRFRVSYLFSFVTSVLYGLALDGWLWLLAGLPVHSFAPRVAYFVLGMLLCALGVALLFHTYIAPEVYELIVIEVAKKWSLDMSRCKTVYDCISCGVSVLLSFLFYGPFQFVGVNVGTVICALCNGPLIGLLGRGMEKRLEFQDRLPRLKEFFQGERG